MMCRLTPMLAAPFILAGTIARAECPQVPGDVSPGVLDLTTSPPTWMPLGDGSLTVADAVAVMRAVAGLQVIVAAPPAPFWCGLPGDVAPGVLDVTTAPPTWRPAGNGVIDIADAVSAVRASVGLHAPQPAGLTATWSGTPVIALDGVATPLPMRLQLLDGGSTISGCAVLADASGADEGLAITGTRQGSALMLTLTPPDAVTDDCDLFPVELGLEVAGDTLALASAGGFRCTGNGAGGHSSLDAVSNPSGSLQRSDVTGSWSGDMLMLADGSPVQATGIFQLGLDCDSVTGSFMLRDGTKLELATATQTGDTVVVRTHPPPSAGDDCDRFETTWTFTFTGDRLLLQSVAGIICTPDGHGGHYAEQLTGGSGTLVRGSFTGRWAGTASFSMSDGDHEVQVAADVLQAGGTFRGSMRLDGGEPSVLTGTLSAGRASLVVTPVQAPGDDCDRYSLRFGILTTDTTWTINTAYGALCDGDGAGGHRALRYVNNALGTLTRQ